MKVVGERFPNCQVRDHTKYFKAYEHTKFVQFLMKNKNIVLILRYVSNTKNIFDLHLISFYTRSIIQCVGIERSVLVYHDDNYWILDTKDTENQMKKVLGLTPGDDCPICMETANETIGCRNCKEQICSECYKKIFDNDAVCPFCRGNLEYK